MTQPRRKGASRIADIPSNVLVALNEGREETATLVEWLAIDMAALVGNVAPGVGLAENVDALVVAADALADQGITRRMHGMGRALADVMAVHSNREAIFESLATHTSDMVRAWAAYSVNADPDVPLDPRLQIARRFAADRSHAVRECAWDSYRQHLANDLELGIDLLRPWVVDEDPNIRRCAVESTRPMGVWTAHIPALKSDPALGLPLLEPVRSDPSRYVQNAVANWLNDASKTQPEWVIALTDRWLREFRTAETTWIVNRALRTLRKQGLTT
jgi:3-methyladenine DNA glycosylase AlkC